MARGAVIVLADGKVALIERHREGELYYLFPGGTVEAGETPAEAAQREAREELGLDVRIGRLVAEVSYEDKTQYYFAAAVCGGVFGTGEGLEMNGDQGVAGSYEAVWLPIAGLSVQAVHPRALALLVEHSAAGWPKDVLRLDDPGRRAERSGSAIGSSC